MSSVSTSAAPATNGFQFTKSTVLGPSGEELTTLDGSNTWLRTNVYVGGRLMLENHGSVNLKPFSCHIVFDLWVGFFRHLLVEQL